MESAEICAVISELPLEQSDVEETAPLRPWHRNPLFATQISVDTDIAERLSARREAGKDQRDVSGARDHRMISIRVALPGPAGVHMNVCHDGQTARLADRPQLAKVTPVKPDDAAVERVWIKVVVEYEVDDARPPFMALPEQERT